MVFPKECVDVGQTTTGQIIETLVRRRGKGQGNPRDVEQAEQRFGAELVCLQQSKFKMR